MSMGVLRRWSVFGLLGCLVLSGCRTSGKGSGADQKSVEDVRADEVSVRGRAQKSTLPTVTVTLPPNGALGTTPMAANGTLDLKDRSSLKSPGGENLPLYNTGPGTTELGVGTITAAVTSKGPVFMRNNALVQGNLVTGALLTRQAGATVTGTISQNATIPAPISTTWTVPLVSSPSLPQTVSYHESASLAPGSYGKLTVLHHGKLTLTSGAYAFSDLELEWDSELRLELDPAKGPVIIYTDAFSAFRSTVIGLNGDPSENLLLVYRGASSVRIERPALMALVAPDANVEFGTGGVTHRGSYYAKGISLDPDVKVVHVPFKYWDWLEPPTPTVSCVLPTGRGKYAVAFGYQNPLTATVTAPLGTTNHLLPDPGSPHSPPTTLLPGGHERAFWAPMMGETLTWNLFGRSATATRTSPRCEFESTPDDSEPDYYSEGRPYPHPGVPPVPAPKRERVSRENTSGAGVFAGMIPLDAVVLENSPGVPGSSTPEVSDPEYPAFLGVPPNIPDGVQFHSLVGDPTRRYLTLTMETQVPGEGWPEGTDLRISGTFRDQPDLNETRVNVIDNVGRFGRGFSVPADSLFELRIQQIEYNHFSDHEAFILRLTVDPVSGNFLAQQESGRIQKHWVFPLPIVISNYEQLSIETIPGSFGEPKHFTFHGDNHVIWTLSGEPAQQQIPFTEEDRTQVCLNWTAYFVDEELPSLDGVTEEFTGKRLENNLRVRGYPASYARYELATKGVAGSHKQIGLLDENGCIPGGVATAGLAYRPEVTDGSQGGVAFSVRLHGQFRHPGWPDGSGIRLNEGGVAQEFHYTHFPGWSAVNGLLVPPETLEITAAHRNEKSTAAAVISQMVRRFAEEGIVLGTAEENPTVIDVTTDNGYAAGTFDYKGQEILDSAAIGKTLRIGRAFFPCADPNPSQVPTADAPCERRTCNADAECPGGQHCARESDAGDGCVPEEGSCYCAWSDQATWKYVVAHELGHTVQAAMLGGLPTGAGGYYFSCPGGDCDPDNPVYGRLTNVGKQVFLADPPLMDPICGCQHVLAGPPGHCLQSIERAERSHTEGFGQFFASLIWNSPGHASCRFNYYKEFLDLGADSCRVRRPDGTPDPLACKPYALDAATTGTVSLPPMTVNCSTPHKWRNQNRCSVDSSSEPIQKATMGTEMDWMTFLFDVNRQLGFTELMNLHRAACRPEDITMNCAIVTGFNSAGKEILEYGRPIAWLDGVLGSGDGEKEHGGILSGAQRRYGALDPRTNLVLEAGNLHGVSDDTSP